MFDKEPSRPPPPPPSYSPVPDLKDARLAGVVRGRITSESGKYGLSPVSFPTPQAATENELAPLMEDRFRKHAAGYAWLPDSTGGANRDRRRPQQQQPQQGSNGGHNKKAVDPKEWFEIRYMQAGCYATQLEQILKYCSPRPSWEKRRG